MSGDAAITTERLILRRWRESDREPFGHMNADPEVMEFYPAILARGESDALVERIEAHLAAHGFGLFALEMRDSGEFIGYTGLATPAFEAWFTPCIEIGWRLARRRWGQGLATEAAAAVMRHAFERLELREIYSFTAAVNARSIRVMERIGMKKAGEFDHPAIAEGSVLRRHVVYETRMPFFHMAQPNARTG